MCHSQLSVKNTKQHGQHAVAQNTQDYTKFVSQKKVELISLPA
jgi:hypothetical protein